MFGSLLECVILDYHFYVGKGKHRKRNKYCRAHEIHYYNDGSHSHAQRIIDKLKLNNESHVVEILYDNLSLNEVNALEILLISRLGRRFNHTGILCNISEGGEINPMDNPFIVDKHLKTMKSESHRYKMSNAVKLFNNSDDYKSRMSEKTKTRMRDIDYYNRYVNYCRSDYNRKFQKELQSAISGKKVVIGGVEYLSIRDANRATGISRKIISKIANNVIIS